MNAPRLLPHLWFLAASLLLPASTAFSQSVDQDQNDPPPTPTPLAPPVIPPPADDAIPAPPDPNPQDDADPRDGAPPQIGDQAPPDVAPTDSQPGADRPRDNWSDRSRDRDRSRSRDRSAPRENLLPSPAPSRTADGARDLRLNFRGAPLEMVLNYLSDAAGFIINLEATVDGTIDVWSNQPLSNSEAIDLLNTVLNKHGYAAIRNGRILTIVARDEAKKRNIPVVSGNNPENIPSTDEMVTQIIPVRFISAVQLVKDLEPLLPTTAQLSANEGGNALVLTDTRNNIRRMVEIVQALDTAIASVSKVQVFALRFADSKALATTIRDLFQTQETGRNNNNQAGGGRFQAFFRGPGGQGGPQGNASGASPNGGRAPTQRVVAVADERSNSVIVSAPEEQMELISGIIQDIDTNVEDITELRVFRLKNADPQETADLLTQLFQDASSSSSRSGNNRQGFQFRFGGQGARGNNGAANQSDRMLKQTQVTAVPDLRTRSVVVSAARDLMDQIALMLRQLDEDPARKQKVFVYSVENTDPQAVQEVIQTLFPEQNLNANRNNRNTQRQNNTSGLSNRQTQNRNQSTRNTGGGGNTGLGNAFGNTGR